MRKAIKESTIRKIIRKELLEDVSESKNKAGESQLDTQLQRAHDRTSNLNLDESMQSALASLNKLFIVACDPTSASRVNSDNNLKIIAEDVIKNCPKNCLVRVKNAINALSVAFNAQNSKSNKKQ